MTGKGGTESWWYTVTSEKRIKPLPFEIVLLDEISERLAELNQSVDAQNVLKGPTAWVFPPDRQYQFAVVPANSIAVVYTLYTPSPDVVGIISQVANSWFANTFLIWSIDGLPRRIEYTVGDVHAPKEYTKGLPFYDSVIWTAHNEDAIAHTFEVLCDGYFMKKALFQRLVGVQGEPLR